MSRVFDNRACDLGEGPLWHPLRRQLFWFDITRNRLLSQQDGMRLHWDFGESVSAAGWIDMDHLLIASETGLWRFHIASGARAPVAALDADTPATRSNDGRADPWGGFWIGTMGKRAERGAGAIHRYYRGELRCLLRGLTIPNAISFPPDAGFACFADTARRRVMRWALDGATGWPLGEAEVFLDLRAEELNPDGAVFDATGRFWVAQWGAARVAAYDRDGRFLRALDLGARHATCPAFGGPDLRTLYCTSARQGLSPEQIAAAPENGMTFCADDVAQGQPEPAVLL